MPIDRVLRCHDGTERGKRLSSRNSDKLSSPSAKARKRFRRRGQHLSKKSQRSDLSASGEAFTDVSSSPVPVSEAGARAATDVADSSTSTTALAALSTKPAPSEASGEAAAAAYSPQALFSEDAAGVATNAAYPSASTNDQEDLLSHLPASAASSRCGDAAAGGNTTDSAAPRTFGCAADSGYATDSAAVWSKRGRGGVKFDALADADADAEKMQKRSLSKRKFTGQPGYHSDGEPTGYTTDVGPSSSSANKAPSLNARGRKRTALFSTKTKPSRESSKHAKHEDFLAQDRRRRANALTVVISPLTVLVQLKDACPGVMLGHRILHRFVNDLYMGTVVIFYPPHSGAKIEMPGWRQRGRQMSGLMSRGLYKVLFDDGEYVDLEPLEAYKGAELYHEKRQYLLKEKQLKRTTRRSNRSTKFSRSGRRIFGADNAKPPEATEEAGERELRRFANPPFKDADAHALDLEILGYWLQFEDHMKGKGFKRPGGNISSKKDFGWSERGACDEKEKEEEAQQAAKPSTSAGNEDRGSSQKPSGSDAGADVAGEAETSANKPRADVEEEALASAENPSSSRNVGDEEVGRSHEPSGSDAGEDAAGEAEALDTKPRVEAPGEATSSAEKLAAEAEVGAATSSEKCGAYATGEADRSAHKPNADATGAAETSAKKPRADVEEEASALAEKLSSSRRVDDNEVCRSHEPSGSDAGADAAGGAEVSDTKPRADAPGEATCSAKKPCAFGAGEATSSAEKLAAEAVVGAATSSEERGAYYTGEAERSAHNKPNADAKGEAAPSVQKPDAYAAGEAEASAKKPSAESPSAGKPGPDVAVEVASSSTNHGADAAVEAASSATKPSADAAEEVASSATKPGVDAAEEGVTSTKRDFASPRRGRKRGRTEQCADAEVPGQAKKARADIGSSAARTRTPSLQSKETSTEVQDDDSVSSSSSKRRRSKRSKASGERDEQVAKRGKGPESPRSKRPRGFGASKGVCQDAAKQVSRSLPRSSRKWICPVSDVRRAVRGRKQYAPVSTDSTSGAMAEPPGHERILLIPNFVGAKAGASSAGGHAKIVLSVRKSTIPNAGNGLFATYEGPGKVWRVPGYVDLGRYGPHSAADIKLNILMDTKNFVYDERPSEWTFDGPPTKCEHLLFGKTMDDQVIIDITSDATGRVHDEARGTLLPFVNEVVVDPPNRASRKVGGKKLPRLEREQREQSVDADHHDDGSLHYLLRPGVIFRRGEPRELLLYYGEEYDNNRIRKEEAYGPSGGNTNPQNVIIPQRDSRGDRDDDMSSISSTVSKQSPPRSAPPGRCKMCGSTAGGGVEQQCHKGTYHSMRESIMTMSKREVIAVLDMFLTDPPIDSMARFRMDWVINQLDDFSKQVLDLGRLKPKPPDEQQLMLEAKMKESKELFPRAQPSPHYSEDQRVAHEFFYLGMVIRKERERLGTMVGTVERVDSPPSDVSDSDASTKYLVRYHRTEEEEFMSQNLVMELSFVFSFGIGG